MTITDQIRSKVYDRVLRSGAAGLTDEEISMQLRRSGDVCRPRRNELVQTGLLTKHHCRRLTTRGRTAAVWIAQKVADKLR